VAAVVKKLQVVLSTVVLMLADGEFATAGELKLCGSLTKAAMEAFLIKQNAPMR